MAKAVTNLPRGARGRAAQAVTIESMRQQAEREQAVAKLNEAKFDRRLSQHKLKALGDFPSTTRKRTRVGPRNRPSSGDYHLDRATLEAIWGDAQHLDRATSIGRAILGRRQDIVVGRGLMAKPATGDPAINKAYRDFFWAWSQQYCDLRGQLTFGAIQRLLLRSTDRDGDGVLLMTPGRGESVYDVCRLQGIEAQRMASPGGPSLRAVDPPPGTIAPEGAKIRSGIEEVKGVPTAYWLGDYDDQGYVQNGTVKRYQARDVLHLYWPERFSSTRGTSRLAALVSQVELLDRYLDATIVTQVVAACQSLIITSQNPSILQGMTAGTVEENADGTKDKNDRMTPGMIRYLKPGEDAKTMVVNQPGPQFDSIVRMILRIIGCDVNLPLEMLLLDFSQSSAYAARSALEQVYCTIQSERELAANLCKRVYQRVIGLGIVNGVLPFTPTWTSVNWLSPAKPVFEPDREAAAAKLLIDNNLGTKEDYCESHDLDYEEVKAQREIEVKDEAKRGITPMSTPGAAPMTSAAVPDATTQQPDPTAPRV